MNHGLLAPQFGLGRALQAELEKAFAPADASAAPLTARTPTVIVKRRRSLAANEVATSAEAEALPEPKTPKIYRLDAPAGGAPAQAPALQAPGADGATTSAVAATPEVAPGVTIRKPRRRRDPNRVPTLIQHTAFEVSPETRAAAQSESRLTPTPTPAAPDSTAREVSMADLLAAMELLRAEFDAIVRARDAYARLDAHMNALGLPSSAGPSRSAASRPPKTRGHGDGLDRADEQSARLPVTPARTASALGLLDLLQPA